MAGARSVVRRYYAYRMTTSFGFYVPVSVLYLLDSGFDLAFVALAQAVFSFALLLAEVPTGYLGDRIGRRASLAVGNACRVVGLTGYVFAESGVAFLSMKVVFAFGWAFRSGTSDAWLYELLSRWHDTDEFARVQGRGSTALLVTSAATSVAGGVLYGVEPTAPFVANAALSSLALVVLATMPSAEGTAAVDEDAPGEESFTFRAALDMLWVQVRRPAVRWVVVYSVLLFAVFDLSRTFEQPALDAIGVPAAGLGLLFAALKLASAGAASTTGWLQERLGVRGVLGLAAPVLGVAYASLALVPVLVVPVLFLYRTGRVIVRPVRNQYVNDRLDDAGRATVLSGISMVLSLVGGVARLVAGAVATVVGPVDTLAFAGAGLAAVAGVVWLLTAPVRATTPVEGAGPSPGTAD